MSLFENKFIKNLLWLFFDKILRIFGALYVGIWLARYLGPNDFGVLSYALSYTGLFVLFTHLGLEQIVVRELVKRERLKYYILGSAFGLKLIGSFLAIVFISVSLFFVNLDGVTKSLIFLLSVGFLFQSVDVLDYFYQSKILSKYVVIAKNSAFILSNIFKIWLIVYEYELFYFAFAIVLDTLLSMIFLVLIYKKTDNELKKWRFSKKIALELMRYAWPLALSFFLTTVHLKIDQLMIGNMLDMSEVGIYSVAVKLSEVWLFFPSILVVTLMPYYVDLRERNKKLYTYRLLQFYSLMFWMAVFVSLVTFMYGTQIIQILYGTAYIGANSALVINIWIGVFVAQALAKGIWVIAENQQLYRIIINSVAVFVNIFLNFILIPKFGISGAAMATLLTRFINNWVTPLFIKSYRENTLYSIKSINVFYVYKRKI